MNHIPELHDYSDESCEQPAKEFILSKDAKKGIADAISQIINEHYIEFEEYASEFLSRTAADRAHTFLNKVLKGDNDAAMALLGDTTDSSRYRSYGHDDGQPWPKIHYHYSDIFLTDGIKLRQALVKSYPDLLKSERIKDLESVVEGLTLQLKETMKQLEEARRQS